MNTKNAAVVTATVTWPMGETEMPVPELWNIAICHRVDGRFGPARVRNACRVEFLKRCTEAKTLADLDGLLDVICWREGYAAVCDAVVRITDGWKVAAKSWVRSTPVCARSRRTSNIWCTNGGAYLPFPALCARVDFEPLCA